GLLKAAPVAFVTAFALGQVAHLPAGNHHEQLPQILPILEARKAALLGATDETVEGAEGNVLLVGGGTRQTAELLSGQGHQAAVVALPQLLHRLALALLQEANPLRNVSTGRHVLILRSSAREPTRFGARAAPPGAQGLYYKECAAR